MSQDFTVKNNSTWTAAVEGATSPQDLRERMIELASRQRRDPQAPAQSDSPLPATEQSSASTSSMRIFYVVNDRYEIFGADDAALDAKEARIRAAFGQR